MAAVLLAVLVAEGVVRGPLRSAAGAIVQAIVSFCVLTVFFTWTMHFLLDERLPLRSLVRSGLVIALAWIGLAIFSSHHGRGSTDFRRAVRSAGPQAGAGAGRGV